MSSGKHPEFPTKESELSVPVEKWLKARGYQVNHEVQNCDMTAMKEDELILLELKLRFSLTLVYQALERKALSPSVYIVIPLKGSKNVPPQYRRMKMLLQRLQIGLMLVRYMRSSVRVEIVLHPREYQPRKRIKRKEALLREIHNRYGEFNRGGQSTTERRITAYRQQALQAAWLLQKGTASPAQLRRQGCSDRVQTILSQNHYGWFDRVERGVYCLNSAGEEGLKAYGDIVETLQEGWEKSRIK